MSSSSDVKSIARRFIQAWNAGQHHVSGELAAPAPMVSHARCREPYHGPEAFKEMLVKIHRLFPDLRVEVRNVIADDDQAFVRWTDQGTFQNREMLGVAASGQSVEVVGRAVYEIENGAVKREEGVVDNLALMQQLGLAPGRPVFCRHARLTCVRKSGVREGFSFQT